MLMQKGFGVTYILIGIVILALLIPTPEYKETVTSCPAVYGTDAKCGTEKGWVIGKPLLWRMIIQATLKPPVQTNSPVPQSQNNETVNWKTYTNKDGKYSIKYPDKYSLEEIDSKKSPEKFPIGEKQVTITPLDKKLNFLIYINYYPILNLAQINEVMEQVSGCDKVNEQKISHAPKAKDFIIDNQKAILYEDSLCAQFTAANFYISYNDRVYSISVASTEKYNLHKDEVSKILATFRFN